MLFLTAGCSGAAHRALMKSAAAAALYACLLLVCSGLAVAEQHAVCLVQVRTPRLAQTQQQLGAVTNSMHPVFLCSCRIPGKQKSLAAAYADSGVWLAQWLL